METKNEKDIRKELAERIEQNQDYLDWLDKEENFNFYVETHTKYMRDANVTGQQVLDDPSILDDIVNRSVIKTHAKYTKFLS